MGNGKLMIGYIHDGKTLHPQFSWSLTCWREHDIGARKLSAGTLHVSGSFLENNRNSIVATFLEREAEWLLFVDSDIAFERDVPYRLLDAADAKERLIVSAFYVGYLANGLWVVWLKRHGEIYRNLALSDIQPESRLLELDAVGMGCCLIHRSVFERIRSQRLRSESERVREDPWVWFGRDLVKRNDGRWDRLSEDLTFCRRAQRAGMKLWGHCEVGVDHIKQRPENIATLLATINHGESVEGVVQKTKKEIQSQSLMGDAPPITNDSKGSDRRPADEAGCVEKA
jgi:hypothetical protein